MTSVTTVQKLMIKSLAEMFDARMLAILRQGGDEEIVLRLPNQASIVKSFSSEIVNRVGDRFPDNDGVDKDINDDAVLAVFICSRILSDYAREIGLTRR